MAWVYVLGGLIRIAILIFGELQDILFQVKYTDIDYIVYSEGAQKVWEGFSPYARHTYRYSPILAYLMLPNVICHELWGKILFCSVDLLAGYLLNKVEHGSGKYWILNPLVINIATRGSAESLISAL